MMTTPAITSSFGGKSNMLRLGTMLGSLLTVALLLGCSELPPEHKASVADKGGGATKALSAGTDKSGEACHYEPITGDIPSGVDSGFNVFCGAWQQPSGRVFQGNAAAAGDLAGLARNSAWRSYLEQRIACGEPENTNILNGSAALLRCTRRSGGWPHAAFVTGAGGHSYFVDGVPSALPALETVVASMSGQAAPTAGASAADAIISAISTHPFGSGDLDSFYQLMQLGTAANDDSQYASAEQAFRSALAIQERILGPDDPAIATPLMDLALQISNQGRYAEADQLFARARTVVKNSSDSLVRSRLALYLAEHEANRAHFDAATTNNNVAETGFADIVPQSLLSLAENGSSNRVNALGDAVMLSPEGQNAVSGLAASWSVASLIAYQNGDYSAVKRYTQRVSTLLKTTGVNPPGVVPRALRLAALSDAKEGDPTAALTQLDSAASLFGKTGSAERPQALTLLLAGRTALASNNVALALALFRQGAALGRERHLTFPSAVIGEYMIAIDQAAKEPGANTDKLAAELFDASQLIQGSVTSQVVSQSFARLSADDPKARDLLRDMQDADLKLTQLYAQRDRAAQLPLAQDNGDALKKIDEAIADTQARRASDDSAAQAASPDYARLVSADASVAGVAKLLGPHEAMLALTVGQKASFGVLIERDHVKEFRIDATATQFADEVAALRKTIDVSDDGQLPVFDVALAHKMYEQLLSPVEDLLGPMDRLVVVPSGALTSLPLETLVTKDIKPVTNGNYKDVPFLVTRFAVSYFPAPQAFAVLRQNTKPSAARDPYIGFGDFRPATKAQLAASFPPDRCGADYSALSQLPPLPGTRKEISTVGSAIFHAPPQDIVLGADFTRARLESMDLTRYRIIHLATHAFLPSELNCRTEPLIAVSAVPGAPNVADAFIGLSDILGLKLDADLVVLSACNTAGPAGAGTGDSLSGLARAFFFAGARGLLVTHWSLDDNAGPLLTALTFTPSGSTADTAEDLRQAKLTMIQKVGARPGAGYTFFTHPFAWAPFVLIGDGIRSGATASAEVTGAAPRS
jgi:CHAT domain-containing protein